MMVLNQDPYKATGPLEEVKQWWDELREAGPPLGYYPNSKKCWLVVKPKKKGRAKEMFAGTGINIYHHRGAQTPCIGAALGSRSYLEQYVGGKVEEWVGEVTRLAEFARSHPQASYAAFTFGLRNRWTYFMRTLPDIQGHPTDLFLIISVLQRKFCWVGTEVSAVLLGRKVLNLRSRIYQMYQNSCWRYFIPLIC